MLTLMGLAACKEASCFILSTSCGDGVWLGATSSFAGGGRLGAIRNEKCNACTYKTIDIKRSVKMFCTLTIT